jgi:hypothetical protein
MMSTSSQSYTQSDPVVTDAMRWRELMLLLQRKAYNQMSPVEIAEQLPDLRQWYATTHRAGAGRNVQ